MTVQLGEQNASALMDLFDFFYRCSAGLGNLLARAELFVVSSDIKDQLVLALADLVTLVVGVATHFHHLLLSSESVSIDVYSTFPGPIDSFRSRCKHVSELMWRHQLTGEGFDGDRGRVHLIAFPKIFKSGLTIMTQLLESIQSKTGCNRKTRCLPVSPKPQPPPLRSARRGPACG